MDGQTLARTNNFFLAGRGFATRSASTVGLLLDAINAVAVWARANPDDLVTSMAAVTGVSVPAQRLAAPRGVYAVQPMDDTIIRQQQAIVDRFASLRIIPSAVDVRSAVWRPPQ
jgi:sulfonate transport system substrate-binding protein